MEYTLITHPNDILRRKSETIQYFDAELSRLGALLIYAMAREDGIGLAAIQLGVSQRVIAVRTEHGPEVFVNPSILFFSHETEKDCEACLSIPRILGTVARATSIKLCVYDLKGRKKQLHCSGFLARVFQHEIDHTNGILFIDKAEDIHERE